MNSQCKIIIAGVGGQGVVFLTEILVSAAMRANIPVATSEIHGLSQRGGSVMAGITIGKNSYGFVEEGRADFLLGLELLEAQRHIKYLHKESIAIVDKTKIIPHSVNSKNTLYPDTNTFFDFLKKNIKVVELIENDDPALQPVMRNLIVLGRAVTKKNFPIQIKFIEEAIEENAIGDPLVSLNVFREASRK